MAEERKLPLIAISAKMEEELSSLDDEDRAIFLEELNLSESGLDKIVKTGRTPVAEDAELMRRAYEDGLNLGK